MKASLLASAVASAFAVSHSSWAQTTPATDPKARKQEQITVTASPLGAPIPSWRNPPPC